MRLLLNSSLSWRRMQIQASFPTLSTTLKMTGWTISKSSIILSATSKIENLSGLWFRSMDWWLMESWIRASIGSCYAWRNSMNTSMGSLPPSIFTSNDPIFLIRPYKSNLLILPWASSAHIQIVLYYFWRLRGSSVWFAIMELFHCFHVSSIIKWCPEIVCMEKTKYLTLKQDMKPAKSLEGPSGSQRSQPPSTSPRITNIWVYRI